jgi:glycosyltransferase involved in cell wall biosynthesis
MKVLLVHNDYRTAAPSGEDFAVMNERRMLERHGFEVIPFLRGNDDLDDSSLTAKAATGINTIWSQSSRSAVREVLHGVRPDVVHVHNTFAMLSPSIYGVFKEFRLPVIQTLHNFRFFCPGALLLRDGKPCEACLEQSLLQSVRYRCYRGSLPATATLAAMLGLHRALGTYSRHIDRYITPTRFGRSKAIKGGIDARKVVVKPNFIPLPPPVGAGGGGYVVFVGRLLEGKGSETLVAAWRHLPDVKLKIIGEGALRPQLEAMARRENLNIDFSGFQPRTVVLEAIGGADLLVMPSECYEAFGLVIAEAFACGTPVLASRIGSMDELIEEGINGRKFAAGDPLDLAQGVRAMLADPVGLRQMRINARAYFDAYLTEEQNFAQLMRIYADAIAENHALMHDNGARKAADAI